MSEQARILQMVRDGKITAEEGLELLEAIQGTEPRVQATAAKTRDRFLRVRVDSADTKVNVNIPLGLLKATSRFVSMGMGVIPDEARKEMANKGVDLSKIDFDELVGLIEQGLVDGKLVDIDAEDEKGRTRVEVYVE